MSTHEQAWLDHQARCVVCYRQDPWDRSPNLCEVGRALFRRTWTFRGTKLVGVPVPVPVEQVPAGGQRIWVARPEQWMRINRLRWSAPYAGLVLVGTWAGAEPESAAQIIAGGSHGPALLSLAGDGMWRFPEVTVQVSAPLVLCVRNVSGAPVMLTALAFWGMPE